MKTKFILLTFIFSFTSIFDAKDTQPAIEEGQTWYLESRSNKLTPSNSKVLYFFSNDAYNVLQARLFSDWDRFSIIDSKNLVRLNTGDRVEILKSKHFEKIYEVKLLDGFEKNRKYFVIKDDLLRHYKLSEAEES
jgi:hypothetical protein|tara:strand:+ start:148 stop:552 length:405 start_codon:yes stop_codon:yes gene_type:complete